MAEITSAVSDDKVIVHFRKVLAPYVIKTQVLSSTVSNKVSPNAVHYSGHSSSVRRHIHQSSSSFMDMFTANLQNGLRGLIKEKVKQVDLIYIITNWTKNGK